MYETTTIPDIVRDSLTTLWGSVADFLPRFIGALVVFLVGWLIAVVLAKLVWHVVRAIQLDRALESIGFKTVWERSGHKLDSPHFFYELVKWFFIIVFLTAATDILQLNEVTIFLSQVVDYIPNVFIAAIILIAGLLVARFVERLVRGSVRTAEFGHANTVGTIVRWAILVFSVVIALEQLGIGTDVIRIAIWGIVAAASIAFGLAFGLGGKSHADEYIAKIRKHIQE